MNSLQILLPVSLNVFLPARLRGQEVTIEFGNHQSFKHLIESIGVPHPEIAGIRVNGQPGELSEIALNGSTVEVISYADGDPLIRPPIIWFILDCHLGKLASYLRILGFDVQYANDSKDETLAEISASENRILLTRDRGLLKRKRVQFGYFIRNQNPRSQLIEVINRYHLSDEIQPFTRCALCNGCLQPAAKSDVIDHLPVKTRTYFNRFWQCDSCGKVYWRGSHYQQIQDWMKTFLDSP